MTTFADTTSDADLARAAHNGAREAFDVLVQRHSARLFRFLRMRTASAADVDDLLQDAFLQAWRKLALYDVERPFARWLFKLAANLAATRTRQRRATEDTELDDLPGGVDPAATASAHDARGNLWDLVHRLLPPPARTALWLFYAEDQSAAAIGDILGRSEGAVRILLFRARETLTSALAERDLALEAS